MILQSMFALLHKAFNKTLHCGIIKFRCAEDVNDIFAQALFGVVFLILKIHIISPEFEFTDFSLCEIREN